MVEIMRNCIINRHGLLICIFHLLQAKELVKYNRKFKICLIVTCLIILIVIIAAIAIPIAVTQSD